MAVTTGVKCDGPGCPVRGDGDGWIKVSASCSGPHDFGMAFLQGAQSRARATMTIRRANDNQTMGVERLDFCSVDCAGRYFR